MWPKNRRLNASQPWEKPKGDHPASDASIKQHEKGKINTNELCFEKTHTCKVKFVSFWKW